MQHTPDDDAIPAKPEADPAQQAAEEPQRQERERSGMLGEPAGIPPGRAGTSDGSERADPVHEQVPNDGVDHWRR